VSALPSIADIHRYRSDVRKVPKAELQRLSIEHSLAELHRGEFRSSLSQGRECRGHDAHASEKMPPARSVQV
jgi:hypothetical protein